jgi:hypothetical protein
MLTPKNFLINAWYLLAIGVGLYFAWREGASAEALLFAALACVAIVCAVLFIAVLFRRGAK